MAAFPSQSRHVSLAILIVAHSDSSHSANGDVLKSDVDQLVSMLKSSVGDPSVDQIEEGRLNEFMERRISQIRSEYQVSVTFQRDIYIYRLICVQKIFEMKTWVDSRGWEASKKRQEKIQKRAER